MQYADIIQGELGSCWFIAALSSLTLRPNLIDTFITPSIINPSGYYQVRLCKRGQWVNITIDDYLPCDKKNQLLFALGDRRQFGYPLIEKGLAKLYGSYEAIAKGACAEGLQTVSGSPTEVIFIKFIDNRAKNSIGSQTWNDTAGGDPEKIWQKIMFSHDSGFIMTCLCYRLKLFFDIFEKNGLYNLHIYSILDVREFEHETTKPIRLLKLRNPWSHKEWKGDWSRNYNWPTNIKQKLNDPLLNDKSLKSNGIFWMSYEDFLKYFYDITICKLRPDWTSNRCSSVFYDYSTKAECYQITILEDGLNGFEIELYATGTQNKEFDRNDSVEIDLCLILCQFDNVNQKFKCIGFEHNIEYFINLSCKLEPGDYLVFATSFKAVSSLINNNNNDESNYFTYNIVFHCQNEFNLNKTLMKSSTIADLFHSVCFQSDRIKYELNQDIKKTIIAKSCIHAILVENLSQHQAVKISLDTTTSKNISSSRVHKKTEDYLNPGQMQLICCLTPNNYRRRFLIAYNMNSEYTEIFPENKFSSKPPINEIFKGLHEIKTF